MNKKTPDIRFKGFSDDWEQRKLGEELSLLKDGTHGTHTDVDDGPYLLSAKNIKNGKVNITEKDRKISKEEYTKIHQNLSLQAGDILLTIVGSIGETAILKETLNITFQRSVAYLRPSFLNNQFLYTVISGESFQKELKNRQVVSAQPGIYLGDLAKINICITSDVNEQIKIGDFFKQLDNTIALHQQKLDLLKQSKKSFLQTLFPKKEKSVPNIRFTGFDEEWEQRKLGEVSDIIGGGTPSTTKKEYWGGNIDWYSPVEIGNNTYVSGSHNKITEIGLRKSSAKILPKGSVLFTSRAGIGKTAILAREGATNQGFQSIVPNKNMLDTYFIFSRSSELKRYGEITGAGSTFVEVSGKQMSKMPIFLPSLEEQVKIGLLFKRVDDTITLQEQKIESLQQMKKSFLQKMFV